MSLEPEEDGLQPGAPTVPEIERYDAIYLSAHLDDAVLSCGGQIHRRAQRGERVMVLTLFTGDVPDGPLSELAMQVLLWMGLRRDDALAARRSEDEAACRELGAEAIHWPFAEACFRRGSEGDLYPDAEALFSRPSELDDTLIEELSQAFELLPEADAILAPLAVGSHVDHHVVRQAAEATFGNRLTYFEDFPYVRKFRALGEALGRRRQWKEQIVRVDNADLRARIRAIEAYSSQIRPLFGDSRRLEKAVRRYASKVGGERLWHRREERG